MRNRDSKYITERAGVQKDPSNWNDDLYIR